MFEGSDPLMKGCDYDLPSDLNHDQFRKTTTKMAIKMGSDMSINARDLSTAFTKLELVMPVP